MQGKNLLELAGAISSGAVRVVDLTFTLSPDFPVIVLPPEFGQAAPVRIQEISRYDGLGPAWYWPVSCHAGWPCCSPLIESLPPYPLRQFTVETALRYAPPWIWFVGRKVKVWGSQNA